MGVGRNLMYRKSLFEKTGGFESHSNIASGDDDLMISAAGSKIIRLFVLTLIHLCFQMRKIQF